MSCLEVNLSPLHRGGWLFWSLKPSNPSCLYQQWEGGSPSNLLGPWRIRRSPQGTGTGAAHPLCSQALGDKTPWWKMALVQKMWGSCPFLSLSLILDILVPLTLGRYQPKRFLETSLSSVGIKREFGRGDGFKPLTPVISMERHSDTVSSCLSGFSLDKAKHLGHLSYFYDWQRALEWLSRQEKSPLAGVWNLRTSGAPGGAFRSTTNNGILYIKWFE